MIHLPADEVTLDNKDMWMVLTNEPVVRGGLEKSCQLRWKGSLKALGKNTATMRQVGATSVQCSVLRGLWRRMLMVVFPRAVLQLNYICLYVLAANIVVVILPVAIMVSCLLVSPVC